MTNTTYNCKLNDSIQKLYYFDYLPILLIILFNLFTYSVFLFGPWEWPVKSHIEVSIFISAVFVSLLCGYTRGLKSETTIRINNKKNAHKFFNIILTVEMFIIPLTLIARTGDFINIEKILSPGQAYMDSFALREEGSFSTLIEYLRIVFSPLLVAFIPMGIYFWKDLSKKKKILFSSQLFFILLSDLQRGTNKGFIDIIIMLTFIGYIAFVSSNKEIFQYNYFKKKVIRTLRKFVIVFIILMALFVSFFQMGMKGRSGGLSQTLEGATLDISHWTLTPFDDVTTKIAIGVFYSYLSQGYYPLYLSLNKPFDWTYGFGHSLVVLLKVDDLLGIKENSYVYKCEIEDGWPMMLRWSSFYPWLASDVTFYGVLFVLFLLAYAFGKCWILIRNHGDFCSLVLFAQLSIVFMYLPLNNQIGQGFEPYFGFLFWLFYWTFTRKYKLKWGDS